MMKTPPHLSNNAKAILLLVGVIIFTSISWPMVKVTLTEIPPMWLGVFRLSIATVCVFVFLLLRGQLCIPSRSELPIIFSIGFLEMGAYLMFSNTGLFYVNASRSAILAYATSIWVTPLALLFFNESLTRFKLASLMCAFVGILVLFSPHSFDWSNEKIVLGNGLLLLSALAWSITILHVRNTKLIHTTLQLAPWQMLLGTLFILAFALHYEPNTSVHWSERNVFFMLYIGIFATGFAYWAVVDIARRLPSITTSLAMLAVPAGRMLTSSLFLGDPITLSLFIALILICVSLALLGLESTQA